MSQCLLPSTSLNCNRWMSQRILLISTIYFESPVPWTGCYLLSSRSYRTSHIVPELFSTPCHNFRTFVYYIFFQNFQIVVGLIKGHIILIYSTDFIWSDKITYAGRYFNHGFDHIWMSFTSSYMAQNVIYQPSLFGWYCNQVDDQKNSI